MSAAELCIILLRREYSMKNAMHTMTQHTRPKHSKKYIYMGATLEQNEQKDTPNAQKHQGLVWNAGISQESVQFHKKNTGTENFSRVPNKPQPSRSPGHTP